MRYLFAFATFWATVLLSVPSAHALEAGAAKVEITPAIGVPLNGYGDRWGRNSVAKHDPLWSRALFLDDGETKVLLVNLDLCVVNPALRSRVLELAPAEVPPEHIVLTATHTHNGHGGMIEMLSMRTISGRFMPEVLEETATKIAQSMQEAIRARRRATLGYGTAKQTVLSCNRRVSEGPIDEQIGVVAVQDADGNAMAILTNFAAHPTSVGDADMYLFSADYPGFYYAEMEKLASKGCVALFMNGAAGNQRTTAPEDTSGWARTEEVGRLLAVRAKAVVNEMSFGDAKLKVNHAQPMLPETLLPFMPDSVFLQTLEINDLLLTFVPGEPCVELGLELRRRALARGYKAQFTVGLANNHLMYFVPRSLYSTLGYESAATIYGPGIAHWFYRQFDALMTRGKAEEPAQETVAAPESVALASGVTRVTLQGSPYALGQQRAALFASSLTKRYERKVVAPIQSGALAPKTGLWTAFPKWIDPSPLAVPAMAIRARTLLAGIAPSVFDELEGTAAGVHLPFDAFWLAQNATLLMENAENPALFETPLCTMFAVLGDRAGADDILVGRNLDWAESETPCIVETRPDTGHAFVQVGFPWNVGVFTGMNDAGLVVAVERVAALGTPALEGAPVELVLREVLETSATVSAAAERLRGCTYLRGFNVLLAGDSEDASQALVLQYGDTLSERTAEEGLLLGVLPDSETADATARCRYERVSALLADERIVGRTEIQSVLQDKALGRVGMAQVWNEQTQHSVVFAPRSRTLYVAVPDDQGRPSPYVEVKLEGESHHE